MSEQFVIVNAAQVKGNEFDPDPSNNKATHRLIVRTQADLAIDKISFPNPSLVDHVLTYKISVINNGPCKATRVMVTDKLPDTVKFLSAESSQGSCYKYTDRIECSLGEIAVGEGAQVIIRVRPLMDEDIMNTATVLADQHDPDMENNVSSVVTTVYELEE